MAAEVGSRLVRSAVLGAVAAASLFASPSLAQTVAGWETFENGGEACGIGSDYEGEGETRLILSMDVADKVLLMVMNSNWSAEEDKQYEDIGFAVNGVSYSGGKAVGFHHEYKKGFVTGFPLRFLDAFAAGSTLHIYKGETAMDRLNLKGSGTAVAHLRRCVARLKAAKAAEEREKAKFADIPKDPFAESK